MCDQVSTQLIFHSLKVILLCFFFLVLIYLHSGEIFYFQRSQAFAEKSPQLSVLAGSRTLFPISFIPCIHENLNSGSCSLAYVFRVIHLQALVSYSLNCYSLSVPDLECLTFLVADQCFKFIFNISSSIFRIFQHEGSDPGNSPSVLLKEQPCSFSQYNMYGLK